MKNRSGSSKIASLVFAGIGIFFLTYIIFVVTIFFVLDLDKFPWKLTLPMGIALIFLGIYYFLKESREYKLSPKFLRDDFDEGNPLLSKIFKLIGG